MFKHVVENTNIITRSIRTNNVNRFNVIFKSAIGKR